MTISNNWIIPLAFVLDLLFKDIEIWPHPVRAIGKMLCWAEYISRSYYPKISLKVKGILSLVSISLIVGILITISISLPVVGVLFKVYFAYAGLSLGGLLDKGREIVDSLKREDVITARKKLSYIVSRDTQDMDENGILTSVAETLAENFNDGFVAPLFYLFIGGPILLWIYKTVSTMDSMWGYKTEKWRELGWAGAKLDDILGFIPARISFFLVFITSVIYFRSLSPLSYIKKALQDAKKMESPNAGWPMAAVAWCFSSTMGGRWSYFGKVKEKPYLGPISPTIPWTLEKVEALIKFLLLAGIEGTIITVLTYLLTIG